MYLRACALLLLFTATTQGFYFSKTTDVFRRTESCQMCYREECFNLETARCEYYLQADEILRASEDLGTLGVRMKANDEDEDLKLRADVNEALFDLVEKASEAMDRECIPYISRYTDCTKENICLGCTSCDCSADGSWNCSEVQSCSAERAVTIDHRVLMMVAENLARTDNQAEDKTTKTKRSVTEEPLNASTNKITFEELSEWWYGVKPLEHDHIHNYGTTTTTTSTSSATAKIKVTTSVGGSTESENRTTTKSGPQTTESTTETLIVPDPENLAFDEVLSNIGIDSKKYVRRKLPMDLVQNDTIYDVDYMYLHEMKPMHNHNMSDLIPNMLSIVEDIDDGIEGTKAEASKVVIDLLESAKNNNRDIKNVTDYMEIYKGSLGLSPPFENTNDIIEYDAVNIMKRDLSYAENITDSVNVTTATNVTSTTKHKCNMNDTILNSLFDLINNMHTELKELKSVKGNFINFVNTYTKNVTSNTTTDDVNEHVTGNTSKSETNLRRTTDNRNNRDMLEKYMKKLKHDIYEVLRDIVGIQKYKSAAEFRDDLKVLVRAMKHYISNNGIPGMKLSQIKLNRFRDLRRYWSIYRHSTSPKDNIIRILNIIDKEMPKAVHSLSATARNIINRVIKQYYIDDFSALGLRAHDSSYNLTNDLQNVGTKWQKLASDTENSSSFEKLYNMKRLHFVLIQDINKVKDALALVDFAHSRRVIPIFKHMETNIVEQIATNLKAINEKISLLLHLHNRVSKFPTLRSSKKIIVPTNLIIKEDVVNKGERQKKSFLKQIRNLLRGSKKDIVELLNKRVPKAEIVKKIARKKMSELALKRYDEYEETMKRWQKNLNVKPRRKRSMLDTNGFRARMKNIIPKYLRGKVDGKIDVKKKKNLITVQANKTKKQRVNTKTTTRKGNQTIRKTRSTTPKLTTPVRLVEN